MGFIRRLNEKGGDMYTKGEWRAFCLGSEGYLVLTDLSINQCKKEGIKMRRIADCTDATFEVSKANAQLISAAPDCYEALKAQQKAIDLLFAWLIESKNNFYPSKCGQPWKAMQQGNQAISKAEGI